MMNPSMLEAHLRGCHEQLIPHREQSNAYGIPTSSSVHHQPLLTDKFPLQLIDPSAFWHDHPALQPIPQDAQMAIAIPYQPSPMYAYQPHEEPAPPGGREKRHSCPSCNKRFDRPSTLKKHLLVHTGEKAWACTICGRRFSVSSNLNRHARRCKEKWARSDSLATVTTPPPPPPSEPSEAIESPPSSSSSSSSSSSDGSDACHTSSPQLTDHRQFSPAPFHHETDDSTRSHDQEYGAGRSYKRRRKGSPTEPWIPASLANFNLDPTTRHAPTPLPAVVPSTFEERNSYAETPSQAYHPSCWTGTLVGPSHVPRNEEISRGRYCGKLLVF
ncbi:hypothetical protein BJ322DRAFT_1052390 [Thelephora terrestris]|uniref:C2H2-type domain-containing protein n=1 Tax=Thelephora terrestris TaxID=56493 RepID=A0A9P6L8K8_9AGAM|nr:hypothetical protein BJ322DRAFT_1052390 [Thelephora terrestris]